LEQKGKGAAMTKDQLTVLIQLIEEIVDSAVDAHNDTTHLNWDGSRDRKLARELKAKLEDMCDGKA
jgi:hypothetical protein